MKQAHTLFLGFFLAMMGASAYSGDFQCYTYTSTTSHFDCGVHGNCVWWAAFKRPDIAAVITGSGWNGGEWSDKLRNLGFSVGVDPERGAIVEFSKSAHVAYVENVNSDSSFDVSEMDATGKMGDGVLYATYNLNSDGTYNRNGFGSWVLKGFIYEKDSEADPSTIPGNTFNVIKVGNYAWYPSDRSCINASIWYGLDSEGRIACTYENRPDICNDIYQDAVESGQAFDTNLHDLFFGSGLLTCHR